MTIYTLDDVTATYNNETVQINNNDSVFGLVPGSYLFLYGELPVRVLSGDNTARTITLDKPWPNNTVNNASAVVLPLASITQLLDCIDKTNTLTQTTTELLNNAPAHGLQSRIVASAVGASYTLSASQHTVYDMTLTQSVTITTALRSDDQAHELTLIVRQGTGGFAVSLTGVLWPNGVPAFSSGAGLFDIVKLRVTASEVIGTVVGLGYSA
tara:strand:+ start:2381 stop:3016 length:636 start_codon:yes stop_codon:yes gene_type:complete